MEWSDKQMNKYFGNMDDYKYKHFNKALGVQVESKEHFRHLLKQGNYVPYEEACKQVDSNIDRQKYTGISEQKKKFLADVSKLADREGKIKWSDGLIKGMKEEAGVDYSYYQTLPKYFKAEVGTEQGGFK